MSIKLVKVKAHLDASQAVSNLNQWLINGNNYADKCAKAVVVNHPVHQQVMHLLGKLTRISQLTNEYHKYVCLIAETILDKHATTKIIETQSHKDLLQVPSFEAFGVQGGTFTVNLPEFCDLERAFPYGEISIDDSNSGSAKSDGLNTHQEKVRVLSSRYSNCIPASLFQQTETPNHKRDEKGGHFYLLFDQLQA